MSVDPLAPDYPWYTPYQFAGNKPIKMIDLDGLEEALPEEEYVDRRNQAREKLEGCAEGSLDQIDEYTEAIDHGFGGLEIFRNEDDGRPISTYSLLRYLEGKGGHDVYDVDKLKEFRPFRKLYEMALFTITEQSKELFNSEDTEVNFIEYSSRGQDGTTLFNDYGTSIGSAGLKYNVVLEQVSDDEIKGTAYFTFADTYRWDPERWTTFNSIAGDHEKMFLLLDLGAKEYSIRSYFQIEFTVDHNWYDTIMNAPVPSNLRSIDKTSNHVELSRTAGYRLLPGGLVKDHTKQ